MNKRNVLSFLTAGFFVIQNLFTAVSAAPERVEDSTYWINPAYAHLVTEEFWDGVTGESLNTDTATVLYNSTDEIIDYMYSGLINREREIVFGMTYSLYSTLYSAGIDILEYLIDSVYAHNSANPAGGDYIKWNMSGWSGEYSGDGNGIDFRFTFDFFTTAAQEAQVDAKVEELVSAWEAQNLSEYEAICAVYGYLTENVTYDFAGLEAGDPLAHSSYKALIEGTSVCQGYSSLFYRLALEMGLDARVVLSIEAENHGWNIVKWGDVYYNMDATWDAGVTASNYSWFLKSMDKFPNHTRDAEYLTDSFMAEYPMAVVSYGDHVEADRGNIRFDVDKAVTAWKADGQWSEGEYYKIDVPLSWISVATYRPEDFYTAKTLPFTLGMSWDNTYVNTFIQFEAPLGHFNTCGNDPSLMWMYGCIQTAFAEVDSTGDQRLEYGIARTSDTNVLIDNVWADYLGSGLDLTGDHYGVTVDGNLITYEFRTPVSAFSTKAAAVDAQYSCAYVISWGDDNAVYAHTQLGSGITGNAGKAAQNFMDFTLVNTNAPEEIPGDLTGDGTIDRADVSMIAYWFAGMYTEVPFDTSKADFNGDGKFTRADGMYLARALAGWEGYILS